MTMRASLILVLLSLPSAKAFAVRPWDSCAQGDFDCVVKATGEVLARDPNDAEAYLVRGSMLSNANKGREDDGLKDLIRAVELDPTSVEAWYWRGSNYWDRKDYENAVADYTEALALNPKHINARVMRCDSHKKLKLYKLALRDCLRAAALDPKTYGYHIRLAELYTLMGDAKAAAAERLKALPLKPKD